jgi:hypothetical protein
MSTPQQPIPYDPGNALLGPQPAEMTLSLVNTPAGQQMAMTIRTSTTTLTVFLAKDSGEQWRDQLSAMLAQMNGLILPPSAVNGAHRG